MQWSSSDYRNWHVDNAFVSFGRYGFLVSFLILLEKTAQSSTWVVEKGSQRRLFPSGLGSHSEPALTDANPLIGWYFQ